MAYVGPMDPLSERREPVPQEPGPDGARTGPIVAAALLTQLVVIGAACNQWVTPHVISSLFNGNEDRHAFLYNLKATVLTYNWRLTPEHGDSQHTWLSQELLVVATLVVSALLIAVVARGPSRFGRVFLTCWLAVMAATMFGTYVRGLVDDEQGVPGARVTRALFGPLGPSPITFFAGLLLGLLVGLVAATVAVLTRRPVALPTAESPEPAGPAYPAPEQPPPYYGDRPAVPDRPLPGEQTTTRFPRPPDDDDLEHLAGHR